MALPYTLTNNTLADADEVMNNLNHIISGTETFTNKTLTTPVINGAITGTATPPKTFYSTNFNAPEGFLINGKIVPSVASNNLTVAIKGMDGNDPSATNPVYCRINGVIRSITAALSKTLNAGANSFNAGSAELATKEIDYFVYLGYNATDGVVVGFSRIAHGTRYDSFSATSTAETFCSISTITNAAAADYYVNIGRFAATLSAGAGYTWTVPTFTATNLIQRPIYETRWLDWQPTYSCSGSMTYTSVTTDIAKYKIALDKMNIQFGSRGTTGGTASTDIRITGPLTPSSYIGNYYIGGGAECYDTASRSGSWHYNNGTFNFHKYDSSNWALAATKDIKAVFFYSI